MDLMVDIIIAADQAGKSHWAKKRRASNGRPTCRLAAVGYSGLQWAGVRGVDAIGRCPRAKAPKPVGGCIQPAYSVCSSVGFFCIVEINNKCIVEINNK